jgi:hypothetical protein
MTPLNTFAVMGAMKWEGSWYEPGFCILRSTSFAVPLLPVMMASGLFRDATQVQCSSEPELSAWLNRAVSCILQSKDRTQQTWGDLASRQSSGSRWAGCFETGMRDEDREPHTI